VKTGAGSGRCSAFSPAPPDIHASGHARGRKRIGGGEAIVQFWNPVTDAGRAALDAMITQQAQIIAYLDDFKLLMIVTLASIPLIMAFKKSPGGRRPDHTVIME
jgi:hypothetical protein